METGQKIANVIIGIIIGCLTISLTLCFLAKDVVKKDIIGGIVKAEMMNSMSSEDAKELKELVDSKGVDKIINGLIDDSINSIETEKYKVSDQTFDELKDYIKDNDDLFKEVVGEEVDIESIVDSDEFGELKDEMDKSFKELAKMTDQQKKAIKLFTKITSIYLIGSLIVAIVVLLVILFLLNKDILVPMLVMGIDLIVSGFVASGLYLLIKLLIKVITEGIKYQVDFTPNRIIIVALSEIAAGIILLVVRKVFKNKKVEEPKEEVKKETKKK